MSSKSQRVFQKLRNDIILGKLHPRERLIENDLVRRYDCSRPVIREAIKELEKNGLVEITPNKGASVIALTSDEIAEIYRVRIELEALSASWIKLPLPPQSMVRIKEIHTSYLEAVHARDFSAIFSHNNEFHEEINRHSGNRHLARLIRQMADRAVIIRYSALMGDAYLRDVSNDHAEIVDALENSDRDKLVYMMRLHNKRGLAWYQRSRLNAPIADPVPAI